MAHVLLVDDDPSCRKLIVSVLSAAGHLVHLAASSQEAIQFQAVCRADLIITDIGMPTIDGFDFLARIRRSNPASPILAVIDSSDVLLYLNMTKLLGPRRVLMKPFSADALLGVVDPLLESNELATERLAS